MLSVLLAAGVITIMFVQLPCQSLLCRELQNSGHVVLFAVMAAVFIAIIRYSRFAAVGRPLADYWIAGGAMIVVAVLTELGQLITQRDPDLIDMLRDVAGIAVGLGLYALADPGLSPRKQGRHLLQTGLLTAIVALMAAGFYPLLKTVSATLQRNQAFPVIADFGAGWTRTFVQLNRASLTLVAAPGGSTAAESGDGSPVARLTLKPGNYPGVSIVEPGADWSGYSTLCLDLFSPHTRPIGLVLRIHDDRHNQAYPDRFNRTLTLKPGDNRIRIPLRDVIQAPAGRELDMTRIAGLMLFAVDIEESLRLYPGVIRLE